MKNKRLPRRANKFHWRYLQSFGFKAATIFDIGVNTGTPHLYRAFADRKLVLIDPLPGVRATVTAHNPRLAGFDFHEAALGAAPGHITMMVHSNPGKSGILNRTSLTAGADPRSKRDVRVTTLDALISEQDYQGPFGVKIDTEGYELEVINGSRKALTQTEFVIAEVSVHKRFVSGYRFSEMIALMAENGFELNACPHRGEPPFHGRKLLDEIVVGEQQQSAVVVKQVRQSAFWN